jgi:hypothetical protein
LIETHTDDADTFTVALGKLLEQLDEQSKSSRTQFRTKNLKKQWGMRVIDVML